MKTKRVNDVYMREVIDAEIKTIKDDELNAYITYKHILKMTNNCKYYINGILTTLADINYTILEYSPINGDYNIRVFIDDKDYTITETAKPSSGDGGEGKTDVYIALKDDNDNLKEEALSLDTLSDETIIESYNEVEAFLKIVEDEIKKIYRKRTLI